MHVIKIIIAVLRSEKSKISTKSERNIAMYLKKKDGFFVVVISKLRACSLPLAWNN